MRIHPQITLNGAEMADLRQRVQEFMATYTLPKLVITTGLDGTPRHRLMGVRVDGFTCYLISVKPSVKLQELQRNPLIEVVYYQYDANDPGQDQPLRLVALRGNAQLLMTAAEMRAFPEVSQTGSRPQTYATNSVSPPPTSAMTDDALNESRFGIVLKPDHIRAEGFLPGPRYPVYLTP